MMKHAAYTAAVSRLILGTATAVDRLNVKEYEKAHPAKNCLRCGRRTHTMFSPFRVVHAEDECTETKTEK